MRQAQLCRFPRLGQRGSHRCYGGAFFEGRFKSIAILDTEALLTVCAYIDLNPVAAGIALTPEESEHTSVAQRVAHVTETDRLEDLAAAEQGSVAACRKSSGVEEDLWLCPIEDRRQIDSPREGMLEGFSLGSYLLLLDYTGRLFREGKAAITQELSGVFDRLGTSAAVWSARMERLRKGRFLGRFFAASRERLREMARRLGVRHLANLSACPAT